MLECVVNLSAGRDLETLAWIVAGGGPAVLDVHRDVDHHRAVVSMAGHDPDLVEAVREVTRRAVSRIDLRTHAGVHPRLGAVDVVPWVPLVRQGPSLDPDPDLAPALAARDRFARWAGAELALPCFVYGPERNLPEVRRRAFRDLAPDTGPDRPHPRAGAMAVGARAPLIAYNLWLDGATVHTARSIAREIRRPGLRTLGLAVGADVQVSCNLTEPGRLGPAEAFDAVAARWPVARAELVGLVPAVSLAAISDRRWAELDLDPSRTIEARLKEAGLDGGSR